MKYVRSAILLHTDLTSLIYIICTLLLSIPCPRYSSYAAKDPKGARVSQMEVRDVDWDQELGSNLLDMALVSQSTTACVHT